MASHDAIARPGLAALRAGLETRDLARARSALLALSGEERRILGAAMGAPALERALRAARERRRATRAGRVIVLPGILGTQLDVKVPGGEAERVWIDAWRILGGRLGDLALGPGGAPRPRPAVVPSGLFVPAYLALLLELEQSWEVRPFGYDWRLDVDASARALAQEIRAFGRGGPVHLVAHSMGGLVARRMIQLCPDVWESMQDRAGGWRGGRLVMLGTPNRGSFAIAAALAGTDAVIRLLALADLVHDRPALLAIVDSFAGSYQMLPSPAVDLGDDHARLFDRASWGALPVDAALLDLGRRFQEALDPVTSPERLVCVAGYGKDTPCAVRIAGPGDFRYQLTPLGDGRVPLALGVLPGVTAWYVRATHDLLPSSGPVLDAIDDLLKSGQAALERQPAEVRAPAARRAWRPYPAPPRATEDEVRALARLVRNSSRRPHRLEDRAVEAAPEPAALAAARLERLLAAGAAPAEAAAAAAKTPPPPPAPARGPRRLPRLRVEVAWGDLARAPGDVYAVGCYAGVMPQGAFQALDAALSGRREGALAAMVRAGLVRGGLGDVQLVPWGARTVAVAGMGFQGTFGEAQLRSLARNLAWLVGQLPGARTLTSVLIGSGTGNLAPAQAARALVTGVADALRGSGPEPVRTLRIVERDRARAREIAEAVAQVRAELAGRVALSGPGAAAPYPGRVVGAAEAAEVLLRAGAAAFEASGPARQRRLGQRAVRRLLAQARGERDRGAVLAAVEAARDLAPRLAVRADVQADRPGVRVSFSFDGQAYRASAITQTATVAERRLGADPAVVDQLAVGDRPPDERDARRLGDLARRLMVPAEFEPLLGSGDACVVEVDRRAARLPWELLAVGAALRAEPWAVAQRVARQLRTQYSAPPVPFAEREGPLRALVIGDPGDPARGESLSGAAAEAHEVARILRGHGVEVELRVGAPDADGYGPTPGVEAAALLDCVDLLTSGRFDLVHYCGHADFDPARPEALGWLFKGGLLRPGEVERLERPPALLVANACLSSRTSVGRDSAALLPSLADEFMRRGVRNYVGAAWPVSDTGAAELARVLYGRLAAGDALGAALQAGRRALWEQRAGFPALWAAYQHYGDPAATLRRPGDEPGTP